MDALRTMFPGSPWSLVLAAMPQRTKDAINRQARLNGIRRQASKRAQWTDSETNLLRQLWPVAELHEIAAALPSRAPTSIEKKASSLGIRRRMPQARRNTRPIHPLIRQLRAAREDQRLTRTQLADRLGFHVNQINNWEMGKARPLLPFAYDWAAALGLELFLRTGAERLLKETTGYPSLKKLTAGK